MYHLGDGGDKDGLNDGSVEVHHHCLWQVEFFELLQEVHPLLRFSMFLKLMFLMSWGDDGALQARATVLTGESHRVKGEIFFY